MAKKSGRSSPQGRSGKKIKKKKRDRFVRNAIILSAVAILIVIVANFAGTEGGIRFGNSEKPPKERLSRVGEKSEVYSGDEKLCRFDFIDVGQGDSTLITTPESNFILIDTGTAASEDKLIRHLESAGVSEIEYLILSHPHNDHIGGARAVLEKFRVSHIIMPNAASDTALFEKLYDAILEEKKDGCKVYSAQYGDSYKIDGCLMKVIGPEDIVQEDLNNCSAAVIFTYGDFDALFAGDTEEAYEKRYISAGINLDSELYKASHHGSDTSSCAEFISAVSPEITVISCGKDNKYGHPGTEAVKRLRDAASEIYVTSELGTVTVFTDGDGYSAYAER